MLTPKMAASLELTDAEQQFVRNAQQLGTPKAIGNLRLKFQEQFLSENPDQTQAVGLAVTGVLLLLDRTITPDEAPAVATLLQEMREQASAARTKVRSQTFLRIAFSGRPSHE